MEEPDETDGRAENEQENPTEAGGDELHVPPPPPLRVQNRSGLVRALAMRTWPSAVTTSASSSDAAAVPEFFEKLPNPPPWTSPATPTVVELPLHSRVIA